ncbi:hypothetical protein G3446_26195 [Thiorhodococcus minor]|uniref:Uncharacterized protein n=1 Tax=Thiorhodococcus minor TaxID=57489 RepID=A0A6M0K682_9GAMM|nr:hypothetical protein [Thiorhodococcus minor]
MSYFILIEMAISIALSYSEDFNLVIFLSVLSLLNTAAAGSIWGKSGKSLLEAVTIGPILLFSGLFVSTMLKLSVILDDPESELWLSGVVFSFLIFAPVYGIVSLLGALFGRNR